MTKSNYARLELPDDIATQLKVDKVAVPSRITRGPGLTDIASIAIDVINTTASVVTVAVAVDTCKRIAAQIVHRCRRSDEITISLRRQGKDHSITVRPTELDAEDRLTQFLSQHLNDD